MDSFAAVLPMPGYSSIYKMKCESISRADVKCIIVSKSAYD
jgi:hypothetical protein